jgi:hypothetical protein
MSTPDANSAQTIADLQRQLDEARNPSYIPEQKAPPETGPEVQSGSPAGSVAAGDIQHMIDQALERQQKQHAEEMEQLRGEVTAAGVTAAANVRAATGAQIAPHAAGPNDQIAETWSQAQQEEMRRVEIEGARALAAVRGRESEGEADE